MKRRDNWRAEASAHLSQMERDRIEHQQELAKLARERRDREIEKKGKVQVFRGFDKTPVFTYRAALDGRILVGQEADSATFLTEEDAERHGWARVRREWDSLNRLPWHF